MSKELRVVLSNKTTLLSGRKGPDFTPFRETAANLIKELTTVNPTPVFKYADNLGRAVTVGELKSMLKLVDVEPVQVVKLEEPKVPADINTDIVDEDNNDIVLDNAEDKNTTFEDLGNVIVPEDVSIDMNDLPPAEGNSPINNGNQMQKNKGRR